MILIDLNGVLENDFGVNITWEGKEDDEAVKTSSEQPLVPEKGMKVKSPVSKKIAKKSPIRTSSVASSKKDETVKSPLLGSSELGSKKGETVKSPFRRPPTSQPKIASTNPDRKPSRSDKEHTGKQHRSLKAKKGETVKSPRAVPRRA